MLRVGDCFGYFQGRDLLIGIVQNICVYDSVGNEEVVFMYLELYNNNRKKRVVKLRVNKLVYYRRSWREEKMGGNKIIIIENCKIL